MNSNTEISAPESNVITLNSARERLRRQKGQRPSSDKRMHPRLDSDDRLFTQIVLSAEEPDLVGTTLSCTAVNLSVGGMQFRTSAEIPAGSLLDLWVDVSTRPGKFFLAGEVRWCRPTNQEDQDGRAIWNVGVQLKTGAATDIIDWRDFHSEASYR